jgi:erythromycin esterase
LNAEAGYGINWRDKYMAENALWIADFIGTGSKITLWAHNVHVAKNPSFSGGGESMGYDLQRELNDLYQVVGFSFSQGNFTAKDYDPQTGYSDPKVHTINSNPPSNSVNFIFHHASHSNFAFHLDMIPSGSAWDSWLQKSRPFLTIGAAFCGDLEMFYSLANLRSFFNWIIHFDRTTASVLLN